jgi:L-iditol 2-dehydrogenase
MANTNNKGVDAVIEAVGVSATVKQSIDSLAFGGTAVWIGISDKHIDLEMQKIVTRELTVKGTFLYGFEEFRTVVEMLNEGKLNVDPILSKEITLEELPKTMAQMAAGAGDIIKATVVNND